jgi:hypothetical protein
MRMIPMLSIATAAVFATACQTWGPTWSEVSGKRYTRADLNRRPATLLRVGDESVGFKEDPFKVAPGTYRIEIQAPPRDRMSGSAVGFTLKLEPCQRYYINADFDTRVGPDWTPVIDHVEPIAGCRVPVS